MAYIREKKNYKKKNHPVVKYQITLANRKTIDFLSKDYKKHEVEHYRDLITRLEKERARGAVYEGTLDKIKEHPDLWRKLINRGILDAPKAEFWTLEQLRRAYIKAGYKAGKKSGTLTTQTNSIKKLEAFYGVIKLDAIDEDAARAFASYCDRRIENDEMRVATRATLIKDARALFNWAVDAGIVATNPFAPKSGIVRGSYTKEEEDYYVDRDEARAVLEACKNSDHPLEWRALFTLARFQGLRVPSETRLLRWADVDFNARRLMITSPKTERYEGKGRRPMPIFKPTFEALKDLRASQREQVFVFDALLTLMRREGHRTGFKRILERAGIEVWDNLFRALRANASNDVKRKVNDIAEHAWIGHSKQVAEKHYYQVLPHELRNDTDLFGDW